MKLSKSEEQLMEIIWKCGKAFMKDIIDHYPDPKPAITTIATLLKRMQTKGYIRYDLFGNSRQYAPLVKKEDYFSEHMNEIIKDYFDNSTLQFASFFTTTSNLTKEELVELQKIIDLQIKNKK